MLVESISREYRGEVGRKKATTKVKRRQQSGAFEKKSLLSLSLLASTKKSRYFLGKILVASTKKSRYFLGKILVASTSREYRGEVGRKKVTTTVNRRQQSGAFEKKVSSHFHY